MDRVKLERFWYDLWHEYLPGCGFYILIAVMFFFIAYFSG